MDKYSTLLSHGYGVVPKLVMKDRTLNIEAKAIYSYICSYAGAGQTAFPSVELMIYDLNLSANRFYKYRKQLIDKGYITIKKQRKDGKRDNNLYILSDFTFQYLQNQDIEKQDVEKQDVEKQDVGNKDANNNILNNNKLNNNSIKNNNYNNNNNSSNCSCKTNILKSYEQLGFGLVNAAIMEFLEADVEIYGEHWVIAAMKEATKQNKHNLKYVEGILRNWKANGRNDISGTREDISDNSTDNKIYKGYDFTELYKGTDTGEDIDTENIDF